MKGVFDSTEKIKAFINPIENIVPMMGSEGIVINAILEKKNIGIYAYCKENGFYALINYKNLFDTFEITKDEKIGVLKISDFTKYFSVINADAVNVEFVDNNFVITDNDSQFSFKTADASMIRECPTRVLNFTSCAKIVLDTKFNKLNKAMKVLSVEEDTILITGNKEKGTVTFEVKSQSIDFNKFKLVVPCQVTEDFENIFNKAIFQMVLSSPGETETTLHVNQKALKIECSNKYSDVTYLIAKKVILK